MKRNFATRFASVSLCATLLLFLLGGCAGRELYERLLIHGIGVDRIDGEYVVTVRAASVEEEGEEAFPCRGGTVLEALNTLPGMTGRQPFYAHNYFIVLGKSCAEEGLQDSLDFFIRYYNTRPSVQVYLAENTAQEILNPKEGEDLRCARLQQLGASCAESGTAAMTTLLELYNETMRAGASAVLPILRQEGDGVRISGTALLTDGVLRAELDTEQTRGFLAATENPGRGEVVVHEAFGEVSLSLRGGVQQISTEWQEGSELPRFCVTLLLKADVSAIANGENRLNDSDYEQLEQALSDAMRERVEAAIRQAVLENSCDIFGFGTRVYQAQPQRWRQLENRWGEQMQHCEYRVKVLAQVTRPE